jgi:hypothetical protein
VKSFALKLVKSVREAAVKCLSRIEKSQFLTDRNVTGGGLDGQLGIELVVERAAAGTNYVN